MIVLIGKNDSSEINDGKLLIKLRDEVVVEAGDGEVENDAMLVDEVGEVVIVVEVELDEKDGVVEESGVIAWDEELVEEDVVVEAGDGEVENDVTLVDEVGEVVIVVEVELDEEDGVVERSGVIAWDEELVEGDVVVKEIEAVEGDVVVKKIEVLEGDVVVEVNVNLYKMSEKVLLKTISHPKIHFVQHTESALKALRQFFISLIQDSFSSSFLAWLK